MKVRSNRQKVKDLYILGAGASYSLSQVRQNKSKHIKTVTPLDKDFLSCLDKVSKTGWRARSTNIVFNDWFDREHPRHLGLEEAIIRRVSQYEFLVNLHPRKATGKCPNQEYLNHLTHLITYYLHKCKSNQSGQTKKFINKIFPIGTDPETYENRVITFNYDTLIERPLLDRGISRKKIYFDRIASKALDGLKRNTDDKFPHPLILKLHGSVNWRCERKKFDEIILGGLDKTEKITVWTSDTEVPKPDDSVSPLIIPPIPNKPITETSLFNHIWTTAYEYLHEAERIIIVGYSCPPTDTLARTMFSQFKNNEVKDIVVVDPNATALKHYREMIEPKVAQKARWRYFSNFSEYIEAEL